MNRHMLLKVLVAFVLGAVVSQRTAAQDTAAQDTAVGMLDQVGQLRADIEYLASDELRGRGVGDESIDVAARYIAQRMSRLGLETDSLAGSPFQPFDVVLGAKPAGADSNRLTVVSQSAELPETEVTLEDGLNPMAIGSPSGQVRGPLVFVGYGITAPDLNYDDYLNVKVDGAIAIVLRKEPQQRDPESRFDGTRNTRHAFFTTKIENAILQGASAVVLVNDAESVKQTIQDVQGRINRETQRTENLRKQLESLPQGAENSRARLKESLRLSEASLLTLERELVQARRGILGVSEAGRKAEETPSVPVVSIARDVVDTWLQTFAGKSLEEIELEIDQTGSPQSVDFPGVQASLAMELEPLKAETSNVIGVLAGRGDLKNETLVVGAHYDHVGMGGEGSLAPGTIAVHNGADDNASGTAAMMGAAAQVQVRLDGKAHHRRVLFIAFSGEERGLLGSKHYVRNSRFPMESTVAMVNLDMVGRLRDNELTVYGTGSSGSFDGLVDRINAELAKPFRLFKVPSGYGPSDHQSFYEAGVPVLFFFTGLHNDYHRPSDDFDKIDFGGLTRITDIVSEVVVALATDPDRPQYAETEKRVQIRRQMTAFLGVSLSERGGQVTVSNVVSGGPAEKGGIKVGDRLEKLGDQSVRSAGDVIEWVRARSPGDRGQALVVRNGTPLEISIQLSERAE